MLFGGYVAALAVEGYLMVGATQEGSAHGALQDVVVGMVRVAMQPGLVQERQRDQSSVADSCRAGNCVVAEA